MKEDEAETADNEMIGQALDEAESWLLMGDKRAHVAGGTTANNKNKKTTRPPVSPPRRLASVWRKGGGLSSSWGATNAAVGSYRSISDNNNKQQKQQQQQRRNSDDGGNYNPGDSSMGSIGMHNMMTPIPIQSIECIKMAFGIGCESTTIDLYEDVLQCVKTDDPNKLRMAYLERCGRRQVLNTQQDAASSSPKSVVRMDASNKDDDGTSPSKQQEQEEQNNVQFQAVSKAYEILTHPGWKAYYETHGLATEVSSSSNNSNNNVDDDDREQDEGPKGDECRAASRRFLEHDKDHSKNKIEEQWKQEEEEGPLAAAAAAAAVGEQPKNMNQGEEKVDIEIIHEQQQQHHEQNDDTAAVVAKITKSAATAISNSAAVVTTTTSLPPRNNKKQQKKQQQQQQQEQQHATTSSSSAAVTTTTVPPRNKKQQTREEQQQKQQQEQQQKRSSRRPSILRRQQSQEREQQQQKQSSRRPSILRRQQQQPQEQEQQQQKQSSRRPSILRRRRAKSWSPRHRSAGRNDQITTTNTRRLRWKEEVEELVFVAPEVSVSSVHDDGCDGYGCDYDYAYHHHDDDDDPVQEDGDNDEQGMEEVEVQQQQQQVVAAGETKKKRKTKNNKKKGVVVPPPPPVVITTKKKPQNHHRHHHRRRHSNPSIRNPSAPRHQTAEEVEAEEKPKTCPSSFFQHDLLDHFQDGLNGLGNQLQGGGGLINDLVQYAFQQEDASISPTDTTTKSNNNKAKTIPTVASSFSSSQQPSSTEPSSSHYLASPSEVPPSLLLLHPKETKSQSTKSPTSAVPPNLQMSTGPNTVSPTSNAAVPLDQVLVSHSLDFEDIESDAFDPFGIGSLVVGDNKMDKDNKLTTDAAIWSSPVDEQKVEESVISGRETLLDYELPEDSSILASEVMSNSSSQQGIGQPTAAVHVVRTASAPTSGWTNLPTAATTTTYVTTTKATTPTPTTNASQQQLLQDKMSVWAKHTQETLGAAQQTVLGVSDEWSTKLRANWLETNKIIADSLTLPEGDVQAMLHVLDSEWKKNEAGTPYAGGSAAAATTSPNNNGLFPSMTF